MRGSTRLIPVLVLGLALAWPAAADAKPRLAGVFDLSGMPKGIAVGPDQNMWVTLSGSSENNTIARIRQNGNVTEYDPVNVVNPIGISAGADGNLWVTRNGGVASFDPADPEGTSQDFDIAAISQPQEIIRAQNLMWTASADHLVSFDPDDPNDFTDTTLEGTAPSARGIASSGGRIWVADFGDKRIVRIDMQNGDAQKSFNVGGLPQDVAKGPQKGAAYTNQGTDPHTVGRIVKGRGTAKKTKVPDTDPFGITFAGDGNWWIANFASHNLTILNREGKARKFRKLPDDSGPRFTAKGPKATVWVALEASEQVARIKGVKRSRRR
jgi:DNA-binding beta-propeller fold protein YncE